MADIDRSWSRVLSGVVAMLLALAIPVAPAYADDGDTLPGLQVASSAVHERFDPVADPDDVRDVYRVYLYAGETLEAALWWTPSASTPVRLFGPGAADFSSPLRTSASSSIYSPGVPAQVLSYVAVTGGEYSIEVPRPSAVSAFDYELHWSVDDGDDDDIPGVALTYPLEGTTYSSMLNILVDPSDVLPLELDAGDTVTLTLAHESPGAGDDFDLWLFPPGAQSVLGDLPVAWSETDGSSAESITYTAGVSGTHYVFIWAFDGSGPYTLETAVAPSSIAVTEVQGPDRIATAIAASELAFPDGADTVIVATASKWPDALGGSALAGALDAPILLTQPAALSPAVADEIEDLGATHVIVLGGENAVEPAVFDALQGLPGVADVVRIEGGSRYATAERIAQRTIEENPAWDGTAFVATGRTFPDALGASPIAAANGWPIYLANPNATTHAALVEAMHDDGVSNALVLGGTAAVASSLEIRLNTAFGSTNVDRLAGTSRYETALVVATHGVESAGLSWDGLALTTGRKFPDALAGGVMQGKAGSVMVLTTPDTLEPLVGEALLEHRTDIASIRILGGVNAVSIETRSQALRALQALE